jgi:hypothetical protein
MTSYKPVSFFSRRTLLNVVSIMLFPNHHNNSAVHNKKEVGLQCRHKLTIMLVETATCFGYKICVLTVILILFCIYVYWNTMEMSCIQKNSSVIIVLVIHPIRISVLHCHCMSYTN